MSMKGWVHTEGMLKEVEPVSMKGWVYVDGWVEMTQEDNTSKS